MLLDQPEPFEIRAASLKVEPAPVPVPPEAAPAPRFQRAEPEEPLEGQLGLDDAEYWSAPV
jgi:hypothetical protein